MTTSAVTPVTNGGEASDAEATRSIGITIAARVIAARSGAETGLLMTAATTDPTHARCATGVAEPTQGARVA